MAWRSSAQVSPRNAATSARRKRLHGQTAVLDRAAAVPGSQAGQAVARQSLRGVADRSLVVIADRIAVGQLVGGQPERVERQGILIRRGPSLLDQAPQDPL